MPEAVEFSVSEFVAVINQTLDYAYPEVVIEGEVAEFRVSKNRWVYFKLIDDESSVQFFGTVYHLVHPIEDGMKVKVRGTPRLHNKYGFSVNVQTITPSGEGDIKKAFELLKKKLSAEGLFDEDRKRPIEKYPKKIGLITSEQAAAYGDFMKILNQRWQLQKVYLYDVQVQGDKAPDQIVEAIKYYNELSEPVDTLVIIRGGGSAEDLQAFSTEMVARAIAGSRTPTIVGVGHEEDISLADLAADLRAATPTNAAQLAVPDSVELSNRVDLLLGSIISYMERPYAKIEEIKNYIIQLYSEQLNLKTVKIENYTSLLSSYDPSRVLKRGYALVRDKNRKVITKSSIVKKGDELVVELSKGKLEVEVNNAE